MVSYVTINYIRINQFIHLTAFVQYGAVQNYPTLKKCIIKPESIAKKR